MQCTSQNKRGHQCKRSAAKGYDKCKLHLGFSTASLTVTTNGTSPVPFAKNKYLASLTHAGLKTKISQLQDLPDLLDLTDELVLAKALLQESISSGTYSQSDIEKKFGLITKLASLVETTVNIKNTSALTQAEIQLIFVGLAQLTHEFVPAEKQQAFVDKLRELSGTSSI